MCDAQRRNDGMRPSWTYKLLLGGALAIAAAAWAGTVNAASCGFLMDNAFGFAPVRTALHPYLSLPQGTTYVVWLVDGSPVTWSDGTTAIRTTGGTTGAAFISAPYATYTFTSPGQHAIVLRCYSSGTQYTESAAQQVVILPPPLISALLLAGIAFMFAVVQSINRRPRRSAPPAPAPADPPPPPRQFRQAYWPHGTSTGSPVQGTHPTEYSEPNEPPRLETLGVIHPPGVDFVPPPIGAGGGDYPRVSGLTAVPVAGVPDRLTLTWAAPVVPDHLVLVGYALLTRPPVDSIGSTAPVAPIVQWPALGPGAPGANIAVVSGNLDSFLDLRPVYKEVASGRVLMDPW